MNKWFAPIFGLLFVSLLVLPVWLSLEYLRSPPSELQVVVGAISLLALLVALDGLIRKTSGWWVLAGVLLGLIALRGCYFAIVNFSGAGFTREVFIHMEWQSLVIAWNDYGRLVRRVVVLITLVCVFIYLASRMVVRPPRKTSLGLLLAAVVGLGLTKAGLPEAELLQSFIQWKQPISASVDPEDLRRFQVAGLLNADIPTKHQLDVQPSHEPKNLILVYLESVGRNLVDQDQWPDLMPAYGELIEDHGYVDFLWASSYITVEGLTNSMCGTLFPFSGSNDDMASGRGLAENLTCLGDVLKQAGYFQLYMGGAGMSFAGKGDFLAAHGYDQLKGLEHWREQGLDQRPGTWGLSDADLFQQSIEEIRRLRDEPQPYNLTLLTIGTHLPGYHYEECGFYPHSDDRFLQALHCKDQLLIRWIEQLEAEQLLDDTVLVITADHHIFPSPEMQDIFGDAVYDRRLPFIVIGDDLPAPRKTVGAGYDIAPTVLDLLNLEHNASFLLGESLLSDSDRPDYYVRRYEDVAAGRSFENGSVRCVENQADEDLLPLTECSKVELIGLLESLVISQSKTSPQLLCNNSIESRYELTNGVAPQLQVLIEGVDVSSAFTYQSRRTEPNRAGLYLLGFDDEGWLMQQRFFPPAALTDDRSIQLLLQTLPRWGMLWVPPFSDPIDESETEISIDMANDVLISLDGKSRWMAGRANELVRSELLGGAGSSSHVFEEVLCN